MKCNTCESKKAIETLKVARGHIEGIIKMIEDERYCIDVSKQLLAVNALVKKANLIILKQHLETCVMDAFEKGDNKEKEEKINEIILILEKYMEK